MRVRTVFEYITRLAVENPADALQGGETHSLRLAGLEYGQIGWGDPHLFSETLRLAIMTSRFTIIDISIFLFFQSDG